MNGDGDKEDGHDNDLLMPGFRFHPTEEELIDFYLRRKVEGKRFHVELIPFLDLYRFDPWELPAMAIIGEKEWFFYVPRDRKYRNGDRPNRVTTSGYWKATGADRIIRSESSRPIGLKKTLVFYYGKAPKGIRSTWIMNEYRLPLTETSHQSHKTEISICRVYKRGGADDHHLRLQQMNYFKSTSFKGLRDDHVKIQPDSKNTAAFCNPMTSSPITNPFVSSTAILAQDHHESSSQQITSDVLMLNSIRSILSSSSSSSSSPNQNDQYYLDQLLSIASSQPQMLLPLHHHQLHPVAAAAATNGLWEANPLHEAID
ncbi:NAC domain-containing protein [Canna indica]|uniref:NAC domain-containing protein n=1 Tax=Canna indica TaxID=4628 RepID=A0AAQ3QHC9_9LILI|nr:NAC domain-containing protein [Canna indica]